MKMTISTETLQDMVARSMKGASCNKMIPLTGFMAIQLKENVLTLITTDATNYFYVKKDKVDGEDFYVVVQADMFSKLVSRLTCESVTMELESSCLRVKGNGSYSIELPLDEEGELVKYPDPVEKEGATLEEESDINLSTINVIVSTAKAALADSAEFECYSGYYAGDRLVSTDTYKICSIGIQLFNEPALVSPAMMELLNTFTEENIISYRKDNTIMFKSESCVLYGKLMESIEKYQIDAITGLTDQEFESSCKVAKDELLRLIDRLSLFVSNYDKNGIYLTFTANGLQIDNKKSNSTELIEYLESQNFHDFTCLIDIEMFRSQVKANTGDAIEIHYGEDNAIKITDGNVKQIVALLEDDR